MKLKPLVGLMAVALLAVPAAARAQEINSAASGDAAGEAVPQTQRAPAMIVHDAAIPQPQQAKSTPPAAPRVNKGSAAPAPADDSAPKPIAMSGRAEGGSGSGAVGTTGNPKYDELVMQSASRNGIDPNLMIAVMRQESGFNPRARSYKGATGLMQLMPATARRFGVQNIWDPAQNIEGGARYLRFLLDTFNGDVNLALAGYNAGENAVINSGFQVPRYRETQNYVKSISARYGSVRQRRGQTIASADPVAPATLTFSGGGSSRLSNNY